MFETINKSERYFFHIFFQCKFLLREIKVAILSFWNIRNEKEFGRRERGMFYAFLYYFFILTEVQDFFSVLKYELKRKNVKEKYLTLFYFF